MERRKEIDEKERELEDGKNEDTAEAPLLETQVRQSRIEKIGKEKRKIEMIR